MYAIARDTTELKVAQSAKEKERRDKEALINNTFDLIWSIDKNFNLITSNTNFLNSIQSQFGDKVSIGNHALNGLDPNSNNYKKWEEYYKRAISGESFRVENVEIHPDDNTETWFEISFNPIKEKDRVEGAACFARNITEFKKAQKERFEAENKYRNVVEHSTNMFYQHDTRGVLTYLSGQSVEFLGYPPEQAMRNWTDFITDHPINKEGEKHVQKAIETGEVQPAYELQLKTAGGKIIWVEVNEAPLIDDGEVIGIVGSLSDISEHKLYEEQLQKSLERYDIVAKATSDTIWDLDLETDRMLYNSNIHNMFGYKKNQVKNLGTWWHNKIHPEDLKNVDEALANVLKNGEERFQMEYRFKAADGSYKYILDRAFVIKDDDGKALRMIGAMQDVTQKEEEEERLKLLESVITNTSESIVIINDKTGEYGREIIYVNKAFKKLTGYSKDEVIGGTLHFLNGPETNPVIRKQLRQAMLDHKAIEVEFINYKKNGEKFWINTSMVPVQNNKNEYTHWVSIGKDITDKKEKEQEIKASLQEKETLLAEIHHRVKNNLAVVSGMMLLQAFDTENEALQSKLYDSVSRIKTMATVHELLYQSNSFSQLEFSETLRKLVENVSETFQTKTKVNLDISCDLVKLNINQAIPASLIVNEVITNAYKHAFKNRDSGKILFNLIEDDEKINITIKDNGVGITESAIRKNSLGLHLIQVLNDQISGTYNYRKGKIGTIFTLSFNKMDSKKGIGNADLN